MFGFVKVATAIPTVKIADCDFNQQEISTLIARAQEEGVNIVCFPELCVTGYTCADLFESQLLLQEAEKAVLAIAQSCAASEMTAIVGAPIRVKNSLFNCAIVIEQGKIVGIVPKEHRPNNNEFYEMRWFAAASHNTEAQITYANQTIPFGKDLLFRSSQFTFGIEICEDLWTPIPPSGFLSLAGAQVIFNLSASNDTIGKADYRRNLVLQQSARCVAGYVYASAGFGESSTDLVFTGNALIAENGILLNESESFNHENQLIVSDIDIQHLQHDRQNNASFSEGAQTLPNYRILECQGDYGLNTSLTRRIDPKPFVPDQKEILDKRCQEILNMQAHGLSVRMHHTGIEKAVIGISGGLDSTLALLVTVKAFESLDLDLKNIIGITLPGYGTTGRTYNNAIELMKQLGVTIKEINIKPACEQHFEDIEHDSSIHNITYENTQARERTQILFDYANKVGGLLIGTGDLSELALGWATYNGDHMSSYAVNTSIPKTLVRHLVEWTAHHSVNPEAKECLLDICDTPISPELLPADSNDNITQKTEDVVGPYTLHDFFLYYTLRYGFSPSKIRFLATQAFENEYDFETINHWIHIFCRRFFTQQFKRSCMPDGPKVGSVNLSPRGDWRMPTDASFNLWIKDLD